MPVRLFHCQPWLRRRRAGWLRSCILLCLLQPCARNPLMPSDAARLPLGLRSGCLVLDPISVPLPQLFRNGWGKSLVVLKVVEWLPRGRGFRFAWGGLLRISEATRARRDDLDLPEDTFRTQNFVVLRINQPRQGERSWTSNSENKAERVAETISLAFSCLPRTARLLEWFLSHASQQIGCCPLEAGGLGFLEVARNLKTSGPSASDAQHALVRRRGRWAPAKVKSYGGISPGDCSVKFSWDLPRNSRARCSDFS